jgi:hypothetical protein
MTTPYIVETDSKFGGRTELKIDLPRFAVDLAKQLGGTVVPAGDYPSEQQRIKVGADEVGLSANNWKKFVHAYISAPDVKFDDRNNSDKAHRTESANVNPDGRSIEAVAKDIKRRVIDASQAALAAQRAYAAQRAVAGNNIVSAVAGLRKRVPGLQVNHKERELSAAIWSGSSGHYISATLSADSTVSVDRIGSMPLATFERLVALLNEGGK